MRFLIAAAAIVAAAGRAEEHEDPGIPGPLNYLPPYTYVVHPFDNPMAPTPTPLEDVGRAADVASIRSKASASDARSSASEMTTRMDAEKASESALAAQLAAMNVAGETHDVKGAVTESAKQKDMADYAAKVAKQADWVGQQYAKMAIKKAGVMGTDMTEKALAHTYKEFQVWKLKVLHDPIREAKQAGAKAAWPFEHALQTTEKRVADMEQRAGHLSAQANMLRNEATGAAGGAVQKQAGGDLAGAAADMMAAHEMVNQATQFNAQALKLNVAANDLMEHLGAFVGAGQGAAQAATHRYAPAVFDPPGKPAAGYAPPPPPFPDEQSHLKTLLKWPALVQRDSRRRPNEAPALRSHSLAAASTK
eukprot:gnl/TRDRNA2_/TRDRNA2_175718_c0_seq3.p1 gnl/TRDRNA2_/TRDRNA2_175718_c0~~gnl/TRDRNA2_/TRDRNA2_175718_c0_seq3.p1  ORF type:complete len:364 (-),score=85.85 gnl/TRDRNA2_/TRDRNA2_175718_c0_seq3:51-1142(-)